MDTEFDLIACQVGVLMNAVFRSLTPSPAPPIRSARTLPLSLPNYPTCHEGAFASADAPSRLNPEPCTTEAAEDIEGKNKGIDHGSMAVGRAVARAVAPAVAPQANVEGETKNVERPSGGR